jgi:alpha-D-ribose 1-methylphosphonate 5-triphosphate synthase subunit PhnH
MLSVDPVWLPDTQQAHFRLLLDAMARPGSVHPLLQALQQGEAFVSVLATLLDNEVSLADPHNLLNAEHWPLLQAKKLASEYADYVLCDGAANATIDPRLGTLASPEQSATLVVRVAAIGDGDTRLQLRGPGIEHSRQLRLQGLHDSWLSMREQWVSAFPLGVDLILVDQQHLTAIPRTTQVEIM